MTPPGASSAEPPSPDDQIDVLLQRGRRAGPMLTAAGMLIFAASIVFSFVRLRQVEHEVVAKQELIERQDSTLAAQVEQIARNEERLAELAPAALRGFGWEGEPTAAAIESPAVRTSLAAHDSLVGLSRARPQIARGQTVVYFAKSPAIDVNQLNFIASLRELGFRVEVRRPVNPTRASNALWYGSEVDPAAVRMVGYALLRAGYELRYVGPFRAGDRGKERLIEIGVSPQAIRDALITPAGLERVVRGVAR